VFGLLKAAYRDQVEQLYRGGANTYRSVNYLISAKTCTVSRNMTKGETLGTVEVPGRLTCSFLLLLEIHRRDTLNLLLLDESRLNGR
jgi:hypothetical protein